MVQWSKTVLWQSYYLQMMYQPVYACLTATDQSIDLLLRDWFLLLWITLPHRWTGIFKERENRCKTCASAVRCAICLGRHERGRRRRLQMLYYRQMDVWSVERQINHSVTGRRRGTSSSSSPPPDLVSAWNKTHLQQQRVQPVSNLTQRSVVVGDTAWLVLWPQVVTQEWFVYSRKLH